MIKLKSIILAISLAVASPAILADNLPQELQQAKNQLSKRQYQQVLPTIQKYANQGHALAQYNLGNMYYNGYGVKPDHTKAIEWWEKSAEQGNENAIRNLEIIHNK